MQFITSSISTTLVLLLLGLVVFFVLTAHNMSVYVRENISFSILISDDMKEADILKLQKKLNQEPFVKQSEYISKKQALKEQTEAMGTDPEEFLGYNPFTASLEIKLHSVMPIRQHCEDRKTDKEEFQYTGCALPERAD